MPLTPEKQLKLFLIQNGFPDRDIPVVLRYCPQLLDSYSIEEIGSLAVTKHELFVPVKKTIMLRPIVFSALQLETRLETKTRSIDSFIEESIAIFSSDSIESSFKESFTGMYKTLFSSRRL